MLELAVVAGIYFYDFHKEFFQTTLVQRAEGYDWQKVDCRPVNPDLPALTMDTPNGKDRICFKLIKILQHVPLF